MNSFSVPAPFLGTPPPPPPPLLPPLSLFNVRKGDFLTGLLLFKFPSLSMCWRAHDVSRFLDWLSFCNIRRPGTASTVDCTLKAKCIDRYLCNTRECWFFSTKMHGFEVRFGLLPPSPPPSPSILSLRWWLHCLQFNSIQFNKTLNIQHGAIALWLAREKNKQDNPHNRKMNKNYDTSLTYMSLSHSLSLSLYLSRNNELYPSFLS